jgi:hypothetical protein
MRRIRQSILGILTATTLAAGVGFAAVPAGAGIDDFVQCEEPDEGIGPPPADQCPDHPPTEEPTEPTEPEVPDEAAPATPVPANPNFTG